MSKLEERRELHAIVDALPNRAKTSGQRKLQTHMGTPREYGKLILTAVYVGATTATYAKREIVKYEAEWENAK